MSILSRVKKAYLWTRATSLYGKGQYGEVAALMEASIKGRPLGVYEQILYAGALAGKKDYGSATELYRSSMERASALPKGDSEYVAAYCQFMMTRISGDKQAAEQLKAKIRRMNPPARLQHFVNHNNVASW